jgi:uncharacterized protein (TIGR02145 family)
MIFLALILFVLSVASVNAQVRIGGAITDVPVLSTILDLHNTDDFKGGLLLPRIALTNMSSLVDIPNANQDKPQLLTGLVVYNTSSGTKGIYMWNGNKWNRVLNTNDCYSVIDDEGNFYYAAQFGEAGCWMTQNLQSTGTFQGATWQSIPQGMNIDYKNVPYYCFPDAAININNYPEYGLLYTWAAANIGTNETDMENPNPSNRQGICPTGWHLPTDAEWNLLERIIAESDANVYSTTGPVDYGTLNDDFGRGEHGRKMKSVTAINGQPTNGTSKARDANGFDALLVGWKGAQDGPTNYGYNAFWWTSSHSASGWYWYRSVNIWDATVSRYDSQPSDYMSVRCKKNDK